MGDPMTMQPDKISLLLKKHRRDRCGSSSPDLCGWLKVAIVVAGIVGLALFAMGVVAFVQMIIVTGN